MWPADAMYKNLLYLHAWTSHCTDETWVPITSHRSLVTITTRQMNYARRLRREFRQNLATDNAAASDILAISARRRRRLRADSCGSIGLYYVCVWRGVMRAWQAAPGPRCRIFATTVSIGRTTGVSTATRCHCPVPVLTLRRNQGARN